MFKRYYINIKIAKSEDDGMYYAMAFTKIHDGSKAFYGTVSATTKSDAIYRSRKLALKVLVDLAKIGINPARHLSKIKTSNSFELDFVDLFPIMLRYYRVNQNFSQQNMADKLGMKRSQYIQLERRNINPSLKTVLLLSRVLDENLLYPV